MHFANWKKHSINVSDVVILRRSFLQILRFWKVKKSFIFKKCARIAKVYLNLFLLNHSKVGAVGLYADMEGQKTPNKTEGLQLIKSHTVCVKAEAPSGSLDFHLPWNKEYIPSPSNCHIAVFMDSVMNCRMAYCFKF